MMVRMRVPARTGPKVKPPRWKMTSIRMQDGQTGVIRQAQVVFCSQACADNPDEASPLGRKISRYLEADPTPAAVCYCCVACEKTQVLLNPRHTPQAVAVPEEWTSIPLIAVDFSSGIVRMTSLPLCGDKCAKALDLASQRDARPEAVRAELVRLFAGITNDDKAKALGIVTA